MCVCVCMLCVCVCVFVCMCSCVCVHVCVVCVCVYVCCVCVHMCACACIFMSKNLWMRFSFLEYSLGTAHKASFLLSLLYMYNLQALLECTHLRIKMLLLAHEGLQLCFQSFLEECKNKKSHNHSLENKVYKHQNE